MTLGVQHMKIRKGPESPCFVLGFKTAFEFLMKLRNVPCMLGFLTAGVLALCFCLPVRGGSEMHGREASFSVMTYNIWDLGGKRPDLKDVAGVIRRAGIPDVLLLQEVRGEKMAESLARDLGFSNHLYRNDAARGHDYGVAILSRFPFVDNGSLDFESSQAGRGVLGATVVVGGRKVRVCTVHLDRINPIDEDRAGVHLSWTGAFLLLAREMTEETVRSRCVKELLAWAGSERVIIGGILTPSFVPGAFERWKRSFRMCWRARRISGRGRILRAAFRWRPGSIICFTRRV